MKTGFTGTQAALVEQFQTYGIKLRDTAKQLFTQPINGRDELLRTCITTKPCHGRVACQNATAQICLKNTVQGIFEQPFVAVALPLQLIKPVLQGGIVVFAYRLTPETQQVADLIATVAGLKVLLHIPPEHPATMICVGWSICTGL